VTGLTFGAGAGATATQTVAARDVAVLALNAIGIGGAVEIGVADAALLVTDEGVDAVQVAAAARGRVDALAGEGVADSSGFGAILTARAALWGLADGADADIALAEGRTFFVGHTFDAVAAPLITDAIDAAVGVADTLLGDALSVDGTADGASLAVLVLLAADGRRVLAAGAGEQEQECGGSK
jgi:hypothetical protein